MGLQFSKKNKNKQTRMVLNSIQVTHEKVSQYRPTAVVHATLEGHVWTINIVVIGLQPGRTGSLTGPGDALGGRACPGGARFLPRDGHRSAGRNTPCG
jgi:hypothetical protein